MLPGPAKMGQMNILAWLCKSGLTAMRLLTIAVCILTVCVVVDLPSLSATQALAKDGADDSGSHEASDDHGGSHDGADDHGGDDHEDNSLSGGEDDLTDMSGSASGSGCNDASISLELQYADGFHEQVSDCTYVLTDQHGRVVITRSATRHDMERLQQLVP